MMFQMFTSKVECSFDLSRFTNSSLFSIAPGDASPLKETYMTTVMMLFWVAIRYADADDGVQVDLLDFDMDGIGMGGFESSTK